MSLRTLLESDDGWSRTLRTRAPEPVAMTRASNRAPTEDAASDTRPVESVAALQQRVATAVRDGQLSELTRRDLREAAWSYLLPPHPPANDTAVGGPLLERILDRASRRRVDLLIDGYLEAYPRTTPAVIALGERLAREVRARDLLNWIDRNGRWRVFHPDGPQRLVAAVFGDGESVPDTLARAGLDTEPRRKGGLARAVFEAACADAAAVPATAALPRQARLLDWLGAGDLPFPEAWPALVEALLRPWRNAEPPTAHKARLLRDLQHLGGGDPRMSPARWRVVRDQAPEAYGVLMRWLTRASVLQFFDVVDLFADPGMWRYRRPFWTSYLLAGHISEAWVAFGSNALDHVRALPDKPSPSTYANVVRTYGNKTSDHCALILRIGDLIIAEWSHNGCYNIWRVGQAGAPKLYQKSYNSDALDRGPFRGQHMSSGTYSWQKKVAAYIEQQTGSRVDPRLWEPKRV